MDVDRLPQKGKRRDQDVSGPAQKKAVDVVRRAMGSDSPVSLSLRELATILPILVEEMVRALRECTPSCEGTSIPTSVQRVHLAEGITPRFNQAKATLTSSAVSIPLSYVSIKIGGWKVWAMVDSGSMVNLLPSKLVSEAKLVRQQCAIGLRALGGFACELDRVVE